MRNLPAEALGPLGVRESHADVRAPLDAPTVTVLETRLSVLVTKHPPFP